MEALGLDIGGSGIKGAVINLDTGQMITERIRLPTPEGAKPQDMAEIVAQIAVRLNWKDITGCGFPAVVHHGVVFSAANIDPSWIGVNAGDLFSQAVGAPVFVANDADVAAMAELRFGIGRELPTGVVMMITLGTGIGSAIIVNGNLMPNTELGHLEIRGKDAEKRASDAVRQRKELTWEEYAIRLQEYLDTLERLFWPDAIIVGGGISKEADKYLPLIKTRAKIMPAKLLNQAGIIGAAVYAAQRALEIK